jgi:hypothetical protein
MEVGFWSFYEEECYNNLRLTNPDVGPQEGCSQKYNELYVIGKNKDVNFLSLDLIDDFSMVDCFLFSDFPRVKNKLVKKAFNSNKPMFLILEECEAMYPANWKLGNHRFFEKLFTWNDDFVDNKKYFKFNVHYIASTNINKDLSMKEKLCTIIASNKSSSHSLELYSKRREAIRWFEKNHPEDFDLYGRDWDIYPFSSDRKWVGRLNSKKLRFLRKLLKQRYPSWRGEVERKRPIIEKYKFYLAYENARDIPGYILEKIFDVFFSSTVPVYLGANNVTDHIPEECFIDKRNFDNYEDLYDYMKGMSDREYLRYLDYIEIFLNSEKAYQFSSEYFANVVINEILATFEQK